MELFGLMLSMAAGGLGYVMARRYEDRNGGEQAWGWDALVWAAVFALSLLIGAILFGQATKHEPKPKQEYRLLRTTGALALLLIGLLCVLGGLGGLVSGDGAAALIALLLGAAMLAGAWQLVRGLRREPEAVTQTSGFRI